MKRRAATDTNGPAYVNDENDDRKFRIEIPNLIDDLGLSVYAVRLYLHVKRRAGALASGVCYEGTRKMAVHCKMSVGKVVDAKKELQQAGLIHINPRRPQKHLHPIASG